MANGDRRKEIYKRSIGTPLVQLVMFSTPYTDRATDCAPPYLPPAAFCLAYSFGNTDGDEAEEPPTPPRLGELTLSSLGSYDASKSPPLHLSTSAASAGGGGYYGGVGDVSPAESARSFASGKGERAPPSLLPEPPDTDTPKRKGAPSPAASSLLSAAAAADGSPFFSASSSPVNKLLRLPRGRSLRFFIDGDDGLAKENEKG